MIDLRVQEKSKTKIFPEIADLKFTFNYIRLVRIGNLRVTRDTILASFPEDVST